jgi:predicted DNA repair protein MutK
VASGIFLILDDIAMLLDDTAAMAKLAAKKTAGLLSDDLAVNAEKAIGFHASRELPVIWAITKGSFLNKAIILPIAFLLSSYAPWLIIPILLLGGAYLSFEGMEKVFEWFKRDEKREVIAKTLTDSKQIVSHETTKIKSAIRTDFILSVEIIMIALETVMDKPLSIQIAVTSAIALLATVAVYGLVALLVRLDDTGLYLMDKAKTSSGFTAKIMRDCGRYLVHSLPYIVRLLNILGTIAMLLVGGGMFVHNIDAVHHLLEPLPLILADLGVGFIVGSIIVTFVHLVNKLKHNIA